MFVLKSKFFFGWIRYLFGKIKICSDELGICSDELRFAWTNNLSVNTRSNLDYLIRQWCRWTGPGKMLWLPKKKTLRCLEFGYPCADLECSRGGGGLAHRRQTNFFSDPPPSSPIAICVIWPWSCKLNLNFLMYVSMIMNIRLNKYMICPHK